MKIEEAVKLMTKQYLGRVLDSFTRDFGPMDEEEQRDFIARNAGELAKPAHVTKKLDLFEVHHSNRVLIYFILEALVNAPDCTATERDLADIVRERELSLLEEAASEDALQYADNRSIEILSTVLEVAFEDDEISRDEYRLLRRLRTKLGITRKQRRILEATLGKFPKRDGKPHNHDQIRQAVLQLERRGILFYCNRAEKGPCIVLPEELQEPVKEALGIELSDNARELLWKNLSNANLAEILRAQNMAVSGTKDELVDRLMRGEVSPSEGLDDLMSDDLYAVCNKLPGVHVSGTKQDRIDRIIEHFDNLVTRDVDEDADPAEIYYEYFTELAARDRENLYANDIITKDLQIEHAFEQATDYLFNEKLGIETGDFQGSDHADGVATFEDGSLFMWDNKSKESIYTFPNSHVNQFKRYIRDAETRVNCFMIIVPEVDEDKADPTCLKLKYASQSDTDIAVITAEDLKWVAENWKESAKKNGTFNLNVFNQTGILDRRRLERGMRLLL